MEPISRSNRVFLSGGILIIENVQVNTSHFLVVLDYADVDNVKEAVKEEKDHNLANIRRWCQLLGLQKGSTLDVTFMKEKRYYGFPNET